MTAVPEIRFPEFDGEWNNVKLGEIVASIDAGWSPQCHEWPRVGDGWGSLKTSSVTWSGFDPGSNKAVPNKLKPRPKLQVEHDDILITRAGPISRVGVVAHVTAPPSRLMISDKLIRIRVKRDRAAAEFVGISLGGNRAQSFLSARKSGLAEAQANISQQIAMSVPVALPTLPEQQKIAAFLGAVDDKIDALRRKHESLKQFKAGLMQKLFSQELRFKRDDGSDYPDWEGKSLSKVARKLGAGVSSSETHAHMPDGFPVYGAGGLVGFMADYGSDEEYIGVIKDGAGVGRIALCPARSSVVSTLEGIGARNGAATRFLYYLLSTINLKKFQTGSTIPHIYFRDYSKVLVRIPHPDEQQKIADCLSAVDAKIEAVERQINEMDAFKKGLLQKMFV